MSILLSDSEGAQLMEIARFISTRAGMAEQAASIERMLKAGAAASHRAFSPSSGGHGDDIQKVTLYFSRLDPQARFESYSSAEQYHRGEVAKRIVMEVDHRIDGCDADDIVKKLANHWGVKL